MLRFLLSIFVSVILAGCDHDEHREPELAEKYALEDMIDKVSLKLADMGFFVDLAGISIDIEDAQNMTAIFGQISDESKREVKTYTPFGPNTDSKSNSSEGGNTRLAFYDPNSRTLVFLRGASALLTDGYLAHELIHIYQDQTWGFDDIWQPYQANPSRELFNTTQFIIEGHAELVRQAYEQRYAKNGLATRHLATTLGKISENDCIVCDFNQPTANLPYSLGMRFLLQHYRHGGWPLVERFFEDLPSSTEQIIHPNKHKKDEPTEISLPEWKDDNADTQLILDGSLGEAFLLSKLLNMEVPKEEAFVSASGWDGDRAQMYRTSDGHEGLVWRILFDRIQDARQMESAIAPMAGFGDVFRVGRVVDWVISDNRALKKRLRIFLSKNPLNIASNPADEQSTIEQEVLIKNDAETQPIAYFHPKVAIEKNQSRSSP